MKRVEFDALEEGMTLLCVRHDYNCKIESWAWKKATVVFLDGNGEIYARIGESTINLTISILNGEEAFFWLGFIRFIIYDDLSSHEKFIFEMTGKLP